MSSKPQLPAIRTARAPPPSTISKTSSESSNATIRPAIRTPRAESPTSRQLPFSNRAVRSNRPLSILGRRLPGSNEAGWEGPGLDNTVWEENTVLDGLAWRLEQFLDIRPPYGLITPEMVAAARQDMKICGPALDMLVSATLADGNAPIWELPVVETDESGLKHASQTLPFSDLNCPEALRGLFKRWANAAVRVAKLESHLQQEIARNICDMELATNVVVPQVNDLAKEFKGIAVEVIRRKTFLSRVTERIKEELRRNDRATLLLPKTRTRLDVVGEVNEPPMSQNSSRSSSRASHRSRSRSHSHSRAGSMSQSGAYAVGSSEAGVYQSTRPRGSSTSLRLGDDGVPLLDDGAETYGGERIATRPEMSPFNRAALIKSGPRPPSRSQQPENILYGGPLPINIPAFPPGVQEAPTAPAAPSSSNLPADITTGAAYSTSTSDPPSAPFLTLGQQDPNQNMFSSPSHSQTYTTSSVPSAIQVPSQLPSHPDPLGVLHLQPMNPNGLVPGPVPSLRGPRPLPQRPTRSPLPQLPGEQRQSPPTTIVNHRYQNPAPAPPPAPPPAPINLGSNFVVPGQAGPSTGVIFDLHSIQVPSETPSFVIPSDSPAPPLEYDLRAARHRYAMSSSSSLSHSDHEQQNDSISQSRPNKRHGTVQPNMAGIYGGLAELNEGSSNPLIPSWAPEGSNSQRGLPHIPKNEKPHKEHGGIFKGVRAFISRNNQSNIDTQPHQYTYQPGENDAAAHRRFAGNNYQHAPSPPDTALSYYYNNSPSSSDIHSIGVSSGSSGPVRTHPPATNGVIPPPLIAPMSNEVMTQSRVPNYMIGSSQVSPGYAEAFQANPVAARSYNGAGPSGSRPRTPSPPTLPPPKEAPRPSEKPVISPRAPAVDDEENLDLVAIRETMYSSMSDALASQVLRPVIDKDAKRAYYSAVCLAILNVGMTVQPESNDTPNLISMMEREIRLSDLPGPYKTCFTQLAAIGREARKLREDDDERAIAYVARGKPLPEPRIGRVQKLLERGVGYVGPDGRIRGTSNSSGGTGRSREFTSKITALALEIMKLSAFREDMLPMLVA